MQDQMYQLELTTARDSRRARAGSRKHALRIRHR